MARRRTAEPRSERFGDLPVVERVLPNGLRALVLPRPRSPVVSCDLYYPVGSANEAPGQTGVAHFVEHMLFKGTKRFPKGQIDRLTFVSAGEANAETDEDCTHYWFRFPKDRWRLALVLEADRMRQALFDPDEVEAERHVIAEEHAREVDSPAGRLDERFLLACYEHHPYRNPILGWPPDLDRLSAHQLKAFYDRHYRPEGAVIILAGDLDPERALDEVEDHFGALKPAEPGPFRPLIPEAEPTQRARRAVELFEAEAIPRGLFGWHTVTRSASDVPPLGVLADLLCSGRRSRLWEALVERHRLATHVDADHDASRWAGQFVIQVEAAPRSDPKRIEAVIRAELDRLARDGPRPEELERSRRRLEAAWRWRRDDLPGLSAGLGLSGLWGRWTDWPANHRAALGVTAEEIQRVVSTYFPESGLTAAWSLPRRGRSAEPLWTGAGTEDTTTASQPSPGRSRILAEASTPDSDAVGPLIQTPDATAWNQETEAPSLPDYRPRHRVMPNGLEVITDRQPDSGIVALELFVDADAIRETVPGVSYLTGRLLEEGTLTRSAEELAEAIEDVGGLLETGPTGATVEIRAEDLPLAVELLAEVIRRPAFPAEAFEWAKRRTSAELRGDRDDPAFRADLIFRKLVYGNHPHGRDPRGSVRQIARLTLDDVREHHRRFFAADNAVIAVAGDFEPRRLRALLDRHFDDWPASGRARAPLPVPNQSRKARLRRIDHPGHQVHLMLGHLGIERGHSDYDALAVIDHVFGSGPGFTDRLSATLRDELGLAYTVTGGMTDSADRTPGLFRVYLGTGPEEAPLAVAAVLEQIEALHRGAFSDEEIAQAVHYLSGAWVFDYQTVRERADRLIDLAYFGLPLDEPLKRPARLAQLTPAEIRAAARRHIHPEALTRVEYGPLRGDDHSEQAECA